MRLFYDRPRPRMRFDGHQDTIWSLAFSPDGQFLASSSEDRTVRRWDLATGEGRILPYHHDQGVNAVAYSPDGKLLASAGEDGVVRLWDRSRKHHWAGYCRRGTVNSVAFSSDGKVLAGGGGKTWPPAEVILWKASSGDVLARVDTLLAEVTTLAFSHRDDHLLVTGDVKGVVRIWHEHLRPGPSLPHGHHGPVRSLAMYPGGNLAVSAGDDGHLVGWNFAAGKKVLTVLANPSGVMAIALSPDGERLAVAGYDGAVAVWEAAPLRFLRTLAKIGRPCWGLAWSPDGQTVAVAGMCPGIMLWPAEPAPPAPRPRAAPFFDDLLGHAPVPYVVAHGC